MTGAVDTLPRGTRAQVIKAVAGQKYPKLAIPTVAANFHLTVDDVNVIINRAGYPDVQRMHAAAAALLAQPDAPTAEGTDNVDSTGTLRRIRVHDLHPDPNNVRENLDDIEDLADSIKEAGLLQPIVARHDSGHLVLIAGHRRLAAVKHLGWTDVPCIIRADIKPDDVLAAMLIENGQRRDLDPIDEARGLRRLKTQLDCTDSDLGKKIGRHQVYVSGRLALLALSAEDQEEVRNGTMKLLEATNRGRLNAGKVSKKGQNKNWHLGPNHGLAERAKARCLRLEHPRGRTVGGMGCGECWESVIRADERDHLHQVSNKLGKCVTCDTPHPAVTE